MTTTPNFDDLTPPDADGYPTLSGYREKLIQAARWGARHGWEQARQLWPEPLTRAVTEADGDSDGRVQRFTVSTGRWHVADWRDIRHGDAWLHTPRWQPQAALPAGASLGGAGRRSRRPSVSGLHCPDPPRPGAGRGGAVVSTPNYRAAPEAVNSICTGCGTPRHKAIAAVANGAMACCPDCSTLTVADRNAIREAVAQRAAPEAVGVTDEEIRDLAEFDHNFDRYDTKDDQGNEGQVWECTDQELIAFARAVFSRYGAIHPAPNHEAWNEFMQELQGLQDRAQAEGIGPRCDMVEWAQMLGTAHPAPVPVGERLPGVGDCDAEGRCWWLTLAVTEGGRGGYSTYWMLGTFAEAGRAASHWRPHWALPLPGVQP